MDSRVRLRLRKWRNEVLDQLQRRTEDLPTFVKGHAAVKRGRALLYYSAMVIATVYMVSILQFHLLYPSSASAGGAGYYGAGGGAIVDGGGAATRLADPSFAACHRGPQYLSAVAAAPGSGASRPGSATASSTSSAAYLQLLQAAAASQQVRRRQAGGLVRRQRQRRRKRAMAAKQGGSSGAQEEELSAEEEDEEEEGAESLTREEEEEDEEDEDAALLDGQEGSSLRGQQAEAEAEAEAEAAAAAALAAHDKYYHFQGLYVPAVPMPPDRYEPRRGIVMTASGRIPGQAVGAYVTAFVLRRVLGCHLPIEVFFVGAREAFGPELEAKLRALGDVKVLSLPEVLARDGFFQASLRHLHVPGRRLRSYAAKPYAMYASSFQEALLFDAGVIPFVDPAAFFHDLHGYRHHGFHLFRDYRDLDRRAWAGFVPQEFCTDVEEVAAVLGGTEADSSCVVLHKGRAWDSLLVAMAMNGPLQPFTYARLNGDKDTWALAAAVTRQNVSTSGTTPGYFMAEADPALALLDGAYAGRAHPLRGHVQFRRSPGAPGGVEPLYLNNQLLNMTEYPQLRGRLAFGLWEDYGYPFCGWRAVNPLLRPPPRVFTVLDAVADALREAGSPDECLCKWFRCRFPDFSSLKYI